ncbi:MAG: hypothetical protein AAGK17_05555 [Pseudomonadota bacterium]
MKTLSKTICILAAFSMSSAAFAGEGSWTISDADGQVTVTRGGKPHYGAEGTVLKAGDVISTSKTARAVLVRGGKFVVVDPGKKVRITKPKEKGTVTKIFEYLGGLASTQSKKNTFNSGTAAAVVKGYGSGLENGSSSAGNNGGTSGNEDDPAMWKQIEPQTL